MSYDGTRVIEGYFECPVPFVVTASATAGIYLASVGGLPVTVTLPTANDATMHHSDLAEPSWHYPGRDGSLSRLPELAPFWGRVVVWADNHTTPKALSISRFKIATDATGDDNAVREVGRQLAEAAPAWWSAVSAWIEILYGQDLSRLGPVEPGLRFNNTTLWTRLYNLHGHPIREGHVLPVGSSAIGLVWPNYAPIDSAQLQQCIALADQHGPPPTEWLIIRDARSLYAGQDFRRAVLDAGLAAELAVTQLISAHLRANGQTGEGIEGVLRKHRMLGRRCDYWIRDCGGTLPGNYDRRLLARRNAATHTGYAPPPDDVRDAIAVAAEIVAQAVPVPG
ncbi:hypothetical protein OG976_20280 [Mycobacterium sp. NBC_00419]|uniref:hypothetical protein n=1 Tax=Mycobacterium sp. NBC_00419 TaxID=2975989 RepID=UPI002E21A6B5